jgi:hypothetical protein
VEQAVQIAGALLILAAFVLAQQKKLATDSVLYLWLNLAGAGTLAVVAAIGRDWGFLLLESVWALVSGYALLGRIRRRETSP